MPAIVSVDLIEIAISEGFSPLGTAPNCLCMHTHVRLRGWIVGKNEAACAADATREVVERWLPNG